MYTIRITYQWLIPHSASWILYFLAANFSKLKLYCSKYPIYLNFFSHILVSYQTSYQIHYHVRNKYSFNTFDGEVAQQLGHWIVDRKISSSSPALPTVLRVRDISNLSSHTVHSGECTGNCAWGLNEELPIAAKSRANKVWITLP